MILARHLNEKLIKLDLEVPEPFNANGDPLPPEKGLWIIKETVIRELVNLLEATGNVRNSKRLFIDLFNREKRATTGIGNGIAFPHVRTIAIREASFCFARSLKGIDFGAIDGELCHLFFTLVAPPYDETIYLKYYKKLASILQYDTVIKALMEAKSPGEIIRIIREGES